MAIIGTFGSYTAARLGIYASQASLNVTGNNIANVNTNGYTRQRMDLRSIYGGAVDRYVSKYSVNIGYGVLTEGVSQLRDPFIDIRYRTEQSNQGQNEFKLKGLDELAATLDEVGDGKGQFGVIERQFNDLLAQLQNLSEKTGSQEYDTLVRKSAETLTNLIRNASKKLGEAYQGQVGEFEANVKEVNTILTNIRNLNESIRKANICGDKALELRDERNLQIDKLSKLVKINVTYDMERIDQYTEVERLNIHLANDKGEDVAELVRGIFVGQLSYQKEPELNTGNYDPTKPNGPTNMYYLDKDGNPTDDIDKANMVESPSAKEHFDLQIDELKNRWDVVFKDEKTGDVSEVYDIQDTDMIGGLQAIRELLTEEGEFASTGDLGLDDNADIKRGIPYYQKSLDALANRFAEIMNEANQLPIKDLSAAYQTDANGLFLNNADPQTALTITLTLDDGTTVNVRGTDKDGNLLDDNGNILQKDGKDLNASMLSYKEKQQILTQLQENGKLTEEYEWYKGGPLFTIGDKADTTDGIVASNITISHAWANRQIQVMNTLRPDSIITYPPTAAQYETGGVTWPSANAAPNTTEPLEIAGITVAGAVGTDNLEGLLNQIVTKYNGQNTGWTASLNENKNGLVFTFDTPGVLPEGTKPPVGVTVPVPASPAVYESKAQAWTNPKEGDTITIGGHTYTVVHPAPKDLPTLLENFVKDYNANAAGNADWTASVGADGKVLFTAKQAGTPGPATVPAGTTQKSPAADATTRIDDLRLKTAGEDEREVTISHSTANDNIDHIISQIGKKFEYDAAGFPGSDAESNVYFTGTFQEYFTNMSHVLATDQETTSIVLNNHDVQLLKESNNRQSVSGVDLNDEATSMMQFQKSYQAACKLLTTLDAMLNTLINNTI